MIIGVFWKSSFPLQVWLLALLTPAPSGLSKIFRELTVLSIGLASDTSWFYKIPLPAIGRVLSTWKLGTEKKKTTWEEREIKPKMYVGRYGMIIAGYIYSHKARSISQDSPYSWDKFLTPCRRNGGVRRNHLWDPLSLGPNKRYSRVVNGCFQLNTIDQS